MAVRVISWIVSAARRIRFESFLCLGRRWNVDLFEELELDEAYEQRVRALVARSGELALPEAIDYFVFPRTGPLSELPPFVVGRPGWDNWMIYRARSLGLPVVDATRVVTAVHQNHDYSYHPEGERGVWQGEEAQENYRLLQNGRKFRTLKSAVYVLQSGRLRANPSRWMVLPARHVRGWFYRAWFSFLNLTRPIRHRLGLKQEALARKSR